MNFGQKSNVLKGQKYLLLKNLEKNKIK
jgi:hypothetical protein